jgi:hypothetical protein
MEAVYNGAASQSGRGLRKYLLEMIYKYVASNK